MAERNSRIRKIMAFPGVFLGTYITKPLIRMRYKKFPGRMRVALSRERSRNRLILALQKKYKKKIAAWKKTIEETDAELPHSHDNKIWICWFQGMENAPEIVKLCYRSMCDRLGQTNETVLLTEENWPKFVTLPEDIVEKHRKGIIPNPHFSDILRLSLLNRYGGTWIDATVFCTTSQVPAYMLNSDFFMVQSVMPDSGAVATQFENYFISASQNQKIVRLAIQLLCQYWRDYDILLDYHISYDLMQLAIEEFPEDWKKAVPFPRAMTELLEHIWLRPYDAATLAALLPQSPFYKLSYKYPCVPGSYYEHILHHGMDVSTPD